MRACVPCLLAALDKDVEARRQYEEDTGHADDTEHADDLAEARKEADAYAAELARLRDTFNDQANQLSDRIKLIESMRATIDELQAAVDSRVDDDVALCNKIALLERDVTMWRSRATRTTAT
jgi:DNA repair exonuclease SbcCD ATPase subunit